MKTRSHQSWAGPDRNWAAQSIILLLVCMWHDCDWIEEGWHSDTPSEMVFSGWLCDYLKRRQAQTSNNDLFRQRTCYCRKWWALIPAAHGSIVHSEQSENKFSDLQTSSLTFLLISFPLSQQTKTQRKCRWEKNIQTFAGTPPSQP